MSLTDVSDAVVFRGGDADSPQQYRLSDAARARVTFTSDGLVPAIVQDSASGRVLMMAWMDESALAYTLATRRGTYWSRSRQEYWIKGMTSGHVQHVDSVEYDCDGDTLLMHVQQTDGACHTGNLSCFDAGHFPLADEAHADEG